MRRILCLTFLGFFVTVTSIVAGAQTPLSFIPTGPCRVADTRGPNGPFGGPSIAAGTSRDFNIPKNRACSIPDTALAYSLNVTVVPSTGFLNYVTVWPAGTPQPVVSSLNSYNGATKADAVIVGAGANSAISIYASDTTNVVLDISGYWVGPSNPIYAGALQYYPLTDQFGNFVSVCNLVNTQNATGALGGPALQAGVPRDFPIQNGNCNIPPNAEAYSLNVTAIPVGGNPVQYVTVWPSTQAQPYTSTLNAPTGTTVANAAVLPTGGGSGDISVFSSDNTNVLIDINGYFAPPSPPESLALYTMTPCRVLDSRNTSGAFTGQIDVDVQDSPCSLPPFSFFGLEAYVLNATVVPTAGLGYFPIWPTGTPLPLPSNLYALDGEVTSNMAIAFSLGAIDGRKQAGGNEGFVSAFASSPTNLIFDIFGYFSSPALVITTTSLPAGTLNTPYPAFSMSAQGGSPPYSWKGAPFPAGLKFSAGGTISGCPTGGTTNPTITVTDSFGDQNSQNFTLTIKPLKQLAFSTQTLPDGTINQPYSATIAASGGLLPYTFTTSDPGDFPPGLSLSANGTISGTPAQGDQGRQYTFSVTVTDSECPANAQVTQNFTITID